MGFFRPQTARGIAASLNKLLERWEKLSAKDRASGDYINPDEPIVLMVPNAAWEGDADKEWGEDGCGNDKYLRFHIMSHGGGGDVDEDGKECGHAGFQLTGMDIDGSEFLYNGRRRSAK